MALGSSRLGVLFARRSRSSTRYLAVVVGALTAFAVCGLFGFVGFLDNAGDRGSGRSPGNFTENGCIQSDGDYVRYELSQYEGRLFAAVCDDPVIPPGLDEFPEPGEVYVSQALADLREVDERIETHLPAIDGIIDPSGLVHANELYFIGGMEPIEGELPVGTIAFDDFGSDNDYVANFLRFDRVTFIVIGSFFTVLPAVYLIAVCTQVNARIRQRQLSILAIMGVSETSLRQIQTREAALTVGTGAIIGSLISLPVFHSLTPTFIGWKAFPGDLTLPRHAPVISAISTIVIAVIAARIATRKQHSQKPDNNKKTSHVLSWRSTILSAGILAGIASSWWNDDSAWPLVLGGRIATFVGLVLVVPVTLVTFGRFLQQQRNVMTSTAGARLLKPSGSLIRSLAALAAGLYVLSGGQASIESLGDDPATVQAQIDAGGSPVFRIVEPNKQAQTLLTDHNTLVETSNETNEQTADFITTFSGSCDALREITNIQTDCDQSRYYIVNNPNNPDDTVPNSVEATPLLNQNSVSPFSRAVITIEDTPPPINSDSVVIFSPPPQDAETLYYQLEGSELGANIQIAGAEVVGGASELNQILDIFRWGAGFAIAAAIIASLLSLIALLHDRRSANNYLHIIGLTPKQTAATSLTEIVIAASAVTAIALFTSWIWALSFSIAADNQPIETTKLLAPFAGTLLTITLASAALTWNNSRHTATNAIPDRDQLLTTHDIYNT